MSNKIDQRIVEMSFENHKFEKGIAQSKNSLKDFANALDGMDTRKDFSTLDNAIQQVSTSFSMLEQIGIGALRRIGESAVDAGARMLKSLTFDQLATGFSKYEEKTASVQTIMNATGKSIDEVNGYLDKLMWFSDETSYGFTDMTAALAQMTSSGGDIDKLIPTITGVANATAFAGKGAAEFSRAMYNLNQSYGRGNLEYMDWKSLELAGVAGKDLKQIFIDTGKALGTLDEQGRTAKGTLVDIGTFGSTLQERWANTSVMEAAFSKFSELSEAAYELVKSGEYDTAAEAMESLAGQYSNIAEKAFRSAQQAKSFSEAIAATMDAVSSGWMRSYEIIFGTFHEARDNFTALTEVLWTVFAASAEGRNEMLQMIKDAGGITSIFQSIKNVGVALLKPLKAISEAFDQFFPPKTADQWMDVITIIENITKKLIMTDETANKIRRTFAGFFAVLDLGWQTVKFLGSALYEVLGIFIPLNGNLLEMSASFGDFLVKLNHVIKQSGVFQYGLLGIKIAAVTLRDILTNLTMKFQDFVKTLLSTDRPLEYLGATVRNIFSGVIDALQSGITWISGKFTGALKSVQRFFSSKFELDGESSVLGILGALRDFVSFLVNGAADTISNFGTSLVNLDFSKIATFVTGGVLLMFVNQLTNLTNVMATLMKSANIFVTKLSKRMFASQFKFKELAVSIGILTASLYVLSKIPWNDLKKGLVGLAGVMLIFVAAYGAIQAVTVVASKKMNGAQTIKTAFSLTALAGGLAIMAVAIAQISKIDDSKVWKSVGVVGAMMGLLTAYQALSVAISLIPGTRAANAKISGMVGSLLALTGLIVILDKMKPAAISSSLGKLAGTMAILAGLQALFAYTARISGGNKFTMNLFTMSAGIMALLGVMKLLTLVSSREITQGARNVLLLGGVLAGVQLMFNLAGRLSGGVKFKTNILAMEMGIVAMIAIAAILGNMDQRKLQNGIKNLTKMAGIIAGLEVLTALAARLGGGHKLQKILGSVSMTLISFTAIIGLLGAYKESTIDKGLKSIVKMTGIIVALEVITALIAQIPGTSKSAMTLIGMVSLILTVTASLALLSMIDQEALRQAADTLSIAVVSIATMAIGIGIMVKTLSQLSFGFSGLKSVLRNLVPGFALMSIAIVSTLGFLAVVRAASPLIESISWENLSKFVIGLGIVSALTIAFTALAKIPGLGSGVSGLGGIVAGLASVGGLVLATAGLFAILKTVLPIVESMSWSGIEKFIAGLGLISAMTIGMAVLSPIFMALGAGFAPALGGVLAAIVGMGLIIGAFVGLSVLMEKLFGSNPDALIQGIDKLVLIGEGMGRFVGAVVGGFSTEAMAGFGAGLSAFADAVSGISSESFDGVESLAKAILALTGTAMLDGLARFLNFGKNPGEVFGDQLSGLVKAFKGISVEDANAATAVLAALAPMTENLSKLADAAGDIPNTGGLLGGLIGNNDMDDFAKQIKNFIKNFKGIIIADALHVGSVLGVLTPMADNLKAFAKAADGIPNSGGFLGDFMGNNDIDDFGEDLAGFISALTVLDVTKDVHKASSVLLAMIPMIGNLGAFAEVAGELPNSGGMVSWITGDNDIKDFTKKVSSIVKTFGKLDRSKVNDANTNLAIMSSALLPGLAKFVTLFNDLNNSGGLKQTFTGESSFTYLAKEIKSFVKILKDVDVSVVAPALSSLSEINDSFKIVGAEVLDSALESFRNNQTPFQTAIVTFLDDTIKIVKSKQEMIASSFSTIFVSALARSRMYINEFRILGNEIVRGLQNGITQEQNAAIYATNTMVGSVITAARDTLEVRSPSKVFDDIGGWLPVGLGNGIMRNAKVAILASTNMATGVEDAVRNTLEVHSESEKFKNIGSWISTSLGNGINTTKSALLTTAQDLGLDTSDMTIQGITNGLSGGEGALTTGINNLLELLTGKKTVTEVAEELGIETGDAFSGGFETGADTTGVKNAYSTMAKDAFQVFKESIDKRKEYNLISAWEEIEAYKEFAKKYKPGTETRMKVDKELGRLQFEYSKTWIDKEKYYKRLSLDDELAAWERVQARYKEGHEYRLQAEREIFRLKQEIWQAEYNHAVEYIDEEKYYGRMNLSEELAAWKQINNMTEEGSDERKKADREIFRLENEINETNLAYEEKLIALEAERNEKRKKLEDDYYAKTKEVKDKLARDIEALNRTYNDAVDARAKSLYSTYGIFDKVEKPKYVSGFELINNLEDQNTAFDKWQNSIGALAAKGVDEGLIKELRDMGPKSLAQINALNRLSDSELDRYVDLWQKKSKEAKDQSVFEHQELKAQTEAKIIELTQDAEIQLDEYKRVWKESLAEVDEDTRVQLEQIQTEWQNAIGGMTENGISLIKQFRLDWFGEIANIVTETKTQMAELQNITANLKPMTDAVTTAINTTLNAGVNTESVGENIVQGVARGVTKNTSVATEAVNNLGQRVYGDMNSFWMIKSPSRKAMGISKFILMGMAEGFYKFTGLVTDASGGVGKTAYQAMSSSLDAIPDLLMDDLDAFTIMPVLDLTGIHEGMRDVNSIIGRGPGLDLRGSMDLLPKIGRPVQNEILSDIKNGLLSISKPEFDVNGTLTVQVVNDKGEIVGIAETAIRDILRRESR